MPGSAITRRNALFVLFLLPGLGMSSWVTRTPDVRDLVGASTAQMGLILFGLSVGSMTGILSAGPLVSRFGTRPIIIAGTVSIALGVGVVGLGAAAGSGVLVACGLAFFGLGMGCGEVAMNVEGAEVERQLHRSVLPAMHGFFSLGTFVGACFGMLMTALRFPVVAHLALMSAVILVGLVLSVREIPAGFGRRMVADHSVADHSVADHRVSGPPSGAAPWRDTRLLLLGCVILALAMAEGTANDWLPLIMVDGHGFDAAWGSAVFAVFALAMTLGRFVGGGLVNRFGRAPMLAASALVGAVGMAGVVFVDHQPVVVASVVLWGLGASLGFPVALSAAGDTGRETSGAETAARVSFAATIGYIAFLVGPPVLGILGEELGLRQAMILVLALVLLAALLTPAARTVRPSGERESDPVEGSGYV
jgi:MFS family permease